MEYATVLIKAADVLFKFLGSPICKEIQSIWNYEEDVEMLARTVGLVKDVLSDMEGKHIQERSVVNAYKRLREVFLDAEDFLDKVETHKKQLEADDRKLKAVRRFCSRGNQSKYAYKVHDEIKEIRKTFNAIAEDRQKFGLGSSSSTESLTKRPREACSFVDAAAIIGRDVDKRRIIDLLLGSPAGHKKIPIVSIVGISGMGKTTLAQLVFNDEAQIGSGRFDLKLWVSDSEKFDMKLLMKKILLCISPDDTSLHNLGQEQLQKRLIREIGGKKCFLVLDDMQNESRKNWVDLEGLLNCGNKESRILVTTRSREVASVIGSASTYKLKGLSDHNAWRLFQRMAFKGSMDGSLAEIGEHIVERCSQVPLAIKTIGCLLFGKNKRMWERVRDIDFAKIKEESNNLMPILKISYDDLDPALKQCFRYCALFPKNVVISKDTLSSIWMANGCIEMDTTESHESAEDVCDDCLKILYNRCFLEEVERNKQGDVTHFKMHPLMHELAKELSEEEMLVVDSGVMVDSGNKLILEQHVRHMNLKCTIETVDRISQVVPKNAGLRTLLCHDLFTLRNPWEKLVSVEKLMSQYQVLRVLDLQKWRIESLPADCIGKLIHLRFLDISYNEFKSLPNSVAELWNLQSLLLMYCTKLKQLPTDIAKLVNLKHLNLEGCHALTHLPSGMGSLTSLQTLCNFIVGPPESKYVARLEDLEPLSNLQGDLTIKLHDKSMLKESGEDGSGAFLLSKRLKTLKIEWPDSRLSDDDLENDSHILAKLQPHSGLEEFTLYGYEGLAFPPWVMRGDLHSVLPNLVSAIIDNSERCLHLPSFSKLPSLRRLTICNLLSLEYIEEDVAPSTLFFPSLEYLWLMELPKLKGWCRLAPGANNDHEREPFLLLPPFPRLSDLYIYGCPRLKMAAMPLSSIQEFYVKGEDKDTIEIKAAQSEELVLDSDKYSSPPVNRSSQFQTMDVNLMLSIPWEQYFKGHPNGKIVSMVINDCTSFFDNQSTTHLAEAFRRMSNCLVCLELYEIPRLWTLLAGMEHLTALRELHISWCGSTFKFKEDEENEQSLQHMGDESLKHLESWECSSLELVSQEGDRRWKGLNNLESLSLMDLSKLVRLPGWFQFLTSLKSLRIEGCSSLKIKSGKGDMHWRGFQSLESLILQYLPQMARLPERILIIAFLKTLTIGGCSSLELEMGSEMSSILWKLPTCLENWDFFGLPKMVRLPEVILLVTSPGSREIYKCTSLEFTTQMGELSWKGLKSLESLTLTRLPKVRRLPEGIQFVTSLKCLEIDECTSLEFTTQMGELWWKGLKSLECLILTKLPMLRRLPEGIQFVTSLKSLGIAECTSLEFTTQMGELSWKGLKSLECLILTELPMVRRLPEGIQFVTSLKSLIIVKCTSLEVICEDGQEGEMPGKNEFTSLETLYLTDLPKLKRLPEAIQFVTSLQTIDICRCESLLIPEWVDEIVEKNKLARPRTSSSPDPQEEIYYSAPSSPN